MQMTRLSAIIKGELRAICLIAIVGTPPIASLGLNAKRLTLSRRNSGRVAPSRNTFQVPSDHAAMHRAVIEAQSTIGKFIAALKHPEPGQRDLEIKKAFIQGRQSDRIQGEPASEKNRRCQVDFNHRLEDVRQRRQKSPEGRLESPLLCPSRLVEHLTFYPAATLCRRR